MITQTKGKQWELFVPIVKRNCVEEAVSCVTYKQMLGELLSSPANSFLFHLVLFLSFFIFFTMSD